MAQHLGNFAKVLRLTLEGLDLTSQIINVSETCILLFTLPIVQDHFEYCFVHTLCSNS
jgi:hypothetical protein